VVGRERLLDSTRAQLATLERAAGVVEQHIGALAALAYLCRHRASLALRGQIGEQQRRSRTRRDIGDLCNLLECGRLSGCAQGRRSPGHLVEQRACLLGHLRIAWHAAPVERFPHAGNRDVAAYGRHLELDRDLT